MERTPLSLLERLTQTGDPKEWDRFVYLFTPLMLAWARRLGIQDSDAEDLVQDVMLSVLRHLQQFSYDPSRSFRAWLRTILVNRWKDWQRKSSRVVLSNRSLEEAARLDSPELDETEYHRHIISGGLAAIQSEFSPDYWAAFRAYVIEERPALEVAQRLGVSTNLVYLAKSRIIARLKQELEGLVDPL